MAKQLCLSAVIELPEDLFQASTIVTALHPCWNGLLISLNEAKVQFTHSQEVMEVRAKQVRRPRKPRLVPTPEAAA